MTKLLIILIAGLMFEAVGVVSLNRGLKQVGDLPSLSVAGVVHMLKAGVTNKQILLGVLFEAIFFGCLIYLMTQGTVSFIWPLTALGFVLTTLAAKFILHEEVSLLRWSGVLLIMLGAGVITYSEKVLEKKNQTPPVGHSNAQQ
jgi:drug/metabolite transporter (DMT)-like permease